MLKASFGYDGMGRQTVQTDWLGDGATIAYQRTLSDNAKSELTGETMTQRQGDRRGDHHRRHRLRFGRYTLAEANGLRAARALTPGMSLIVPTGGRREYPQRIDVQTLTARQASWAWST